MQCFSGLAFWLGSPWYEQEAYSGEYNQSNEYVEGQGITLGSIVKVASK